MSPSSPTERTSATPLERAAGLPIWTGPVAPEPLAGGITNQNFTVRDAGRRFLVRIGGDIPEHMILRRFELAAARAAHAAGLSPAVRHAEEGALVLDFIEGRSLDAADVRDAVNLDSLTELVRRCHTEIPRHFRGPAPIFWVFQVVRDYAQTLRASTPHDLGPLLAAAETLERAIGSVEIVFGHNDLLPANIIDDGSRLWLVDWEYAGFNSPLFDLGGLASNAGMTPAEREALLAAYYRRPPDAPLLRQAAAMTAASLLRETMWSMVSELHSTIDFDYAAYTAENRARFDAAFAAFEELR
ncbi:MAG: choline/ethanolamine kinase family protein [Amaricoccus sp.]